MGAGAGYSLETKDVKITGGVQVFSFNKSGEDKFSVFHFDVITVECKVPIIGSVRAESYMYGCDWIKDVPMTVSEVIINVPHDVNETMPITESEVINILENPANYEGDGVYGGGYAHSTFDGFFDISPRGDYADDIESVNIHIDHQNIIQFIDLAVLGDNKEYEVRLNGDPIDSCESEAEAIDVLNAAIQEEIDENGIDSIDFSECTVEELYWKEDVEGNMDIVDPWYDNIVYTADPDDFEDFADTLDELDEDFNPGIDTDYDI